MNPELLTVKVSTMLLLLRPLYKQMTNHLCITGLHRLVLTMKTTVAWSHSLGGTYLTKPRIVSQITFAQTMAQLCCHNDTCNEKVESNSCLPVMFACHCISMSASCCIHQTPIAVMSCGLCTYSSGQNWFRSCNCTLGTLPRTACNR